MVERRQEVGHRPWDFDLIRVSSASELARMADSLCDILRFRGEAR